MAQSAIAASPSAPAVSHKASLRLVGAPRPPQADGPSSGRAVVFGADFNTPRKRPQRHAALLAFKQELGLEDSGVHPSHTDWHACQRDFILIRNGDAVRLDVISGGEPPASVPGAGPDGVDFCDGDAWRGRALSDHPALAVLLEAAAID
ncbi:MAG: hypothetical protein EA417_05685 [Gammaproteobacteria bacterium]|nr:MAG: hypothetical protein EA417_05685 [Gammaproteobacteria bacterium]